MEFCEIALNRLRIDVMRRRRHRSQIVYQSSRKAYCVSQFS